MHDAYTALTVLIRAIAREMMIEVAPHLGAADELLPLATAAQIVGKTPRAIRDAGRRGEIAIVRVGRSPRVRRSALTAWARPAAVAPRASDARDDVRAAIAAAARGSR